MRDLTVAGVQVPGAQYDRRTRSLRVYTAMTLTVHVPRRRALAAGRERTAFEAPFERIYGSALENYTDGQALAGGARAATDEDAQEFVPACGEEYLIVTSAALRPAADRLADAKRAAGYVVGIHEVAPGTPPPTCARSSAAS